MNTLHVYKNWQNFFSNSRASLICDGWPEQETASFAIMAVIAADI